MPASIPVFVILDPRTRLYWSRLADRMGWGNDPKCIVMFADGNRAGEQLCKLVPTRPGARLVKAWCDISEDGLTCDAPGLDAVRGARFQRAASSDGTLETCPTKGA